jgi:hypothetical protein
LLCGGLIVSTFWLGSAIGNIRIFKKTGEIFVTITYGSIMFVYKLIKTPFGLIYRKQDVIVLPINNYEIDEDLLRKGGKMKTKKHRNKNKVTCKRKNKKTTQRKKKTTKCSKRRK